MNAGALDKLEQRVQNGDVDAIREYTIDAFKSQFGNRDELHRRRMILARLETEVCTPIECFALISAAMEDRHAWDMAIGRLGDARDPGLGFLAWQLILHYSKDKERADRWFHAVQEAAQLGHFPSKRQALIREIGRTGFFSGLKFRRQLFALERKRQKLEASEPSSRLLATYTN